MTEPHFDDSEDAFVVELEDFSGPLDLLLHLVRLQEVEITDIPIAKIASQFLTAIGRLGLNQAADYLEMAALLLRIKIQMLLPRPIGDDTWEDPRAELVRRLLEYEQIKEIARRFVEQAEYRSAQFVRGWLPPEPEPSPRPIVVDVEDLLRTVEEVVASIPQPIMHRVLVRPLDVEGARERIEELIKHRSSLTFKAIVGENPSVPDVPSAFLALLEMARLGVVRLAQRKIFNTFTIENEEADKAG